MGAKFCTYCQSLILRGGFYSNRKCAMGRKNMATIKQKELIQRLAEELKIDVSNKNFESLTKVKASEIIDKLIKRKDDEELYRNEDE